jgi:uncharacterized membrane protein YozB (DUF420 family)
VSREGLLWWPALNASLNLASTTLLVCGWLMIRRRSVRLHAACMLGALGVSAVFVVSYLLYHYRVGATPFPGTGAWRSVYFAILISHTTLAATVPPLALWTLWRAARRRFDAHARLARWALPVWLYVNVTGVIVYLMLYQIFGRG